MLKGVFSIPPVIAVAFFGLFLTFIAIVVPMMEMTTYAAESSKTLKNSNAIDLAHSIEVCLRDGKEYVQWDIQGGISGAMKKCGLVANYVEIEDQANPPSDSNMMKMGTKRNEEPFHIMFVSIQRGEEVHPGRLYVEP